MHTVLLLEDNDLIRKSLQLSLVKYYRVIACSCLRETEELDLDRIDMALLDIGLPDGSGLDYFKQIRLYRDFPVIFLTAKDEEETIVKAFRSGASDYMTKPFRTGELLARMERLLPDRISYRNIRMDLSRRRAFLDEKELALSTREFDLMVYLIRNKNRAVTRESLLMLWEQEDRSVNDNTLSVYMSKLRQKLKLDFLRTIKNVGYRLDEE